MANKATREITVKEYAAIHGSTEQNIRKHIRKGNHLPGVIRIKRFSRFVVLVVPADLSAASKEFQT